MLVASGWRSTSENGNVSGHEAAQVAFVVEVMPKEVHWDDDETRWRHKNVAQIVTKVFTDFHHRQLRLAFAGTAAG